MIALKSVCIGNPKNIIADPLFENPCLKPCTILSFFFYFLLINKLYFVSKCTCYILLNFIVKILKQNRVHHYKMCCRQLLFHLCQLLFGTRVKYEYLILNCYDFHILYIEIKNLDKYVSDENKTVQRFYQFTVS